MPIDLSELSPEKRRELEGNPELMKSLEDAIHVNVKDGLGPPNWQGNTQDESAADPSLQAAVHMARTLSSLQPSELTRLQEWFDRQDVMKVGPQLLVCPSCGDIDRKNRMNGQSWCFKCNVPLVTREKVEKWAKFPRIKITSKSQHPTLIGEE